MIRILVEISSVDEKVKDYVLQEYIQRCKRRHHLAFFQWRTFFSNMIQTYPSSCHLGRPVMREIMQGIVDDIMVGGVEMNDNYSIQERTVKMGAFCPIYN